MATTRMRRSRPSDDDLLDAACAVFADGGFHRASMDVIAEHAGSTKPTLYAHFGSKDGLYAAALQREADRCRDWLLAHYAAVAHLSQDEQISRDVRAFFDYVAAHPDGFRLLFVTDRTGAAPVREELLDGLTRHIAQRLYDFTTSTSGGTPRRTHRQLAAALVGVSINGAEFAVTTGTSLRSAARVAASFAVAGVTHLDD